MKNSAVNSAVSQALIYFPALVAFTIPIMGTLIPLGLAPLLAGAALIQIVGLRLRRENWPKTGATVPLMVLAYGAWSAATLIWTPDGSEAAEKLLRLVVLISLGLGYLAATRDSAAKQACSIALLAGTCVAVTGLLIEKAWGAPFYRLFFDEIPIHDINLFFNRFNRGVTVICLVAWPAAHAAAKFHRFAGIALIAAIIGLAAWMNSAAALLAIVAGALCYGLIWKFPLKRVLSALGVFAAAVILLTPAIIDRIPDANGSPEIKSALPESAYHRLLIWKFSNERIAERPLSGWGFYASRFIPGGTEKLEGELAGLPLHPHNTALQWRLELGLPGAILGAIVLMLLFRRIAGYTDRTDRATLAATLTTGVTIAFLSYGIWQSWWVAALIFSAASARLALGQERTGR